jgi:hypothetical protein
MTKSDQGDALSLDARIAVEQGQSVKFQRSFNLVVSICNLARINKILQAYFEKRLWENFITSVLFDTSSYLGLVFFSGCDTGVDRRWMMECSINSILREATAQYIKLRYILSPLRFRQAAFFGVMASGSPQHICKHTVVWE